MTSLLRAAASVALLALVVVPSIDASTGQSLDQAGPTIDGLVSSLQTIALNTPNSCIMHVLNPVPGNTVSVESNPPNLADGFLVDENTGDGTLNLYYANPGQAASGTITINIPLDRPEIFNVQGSTQVLINDGFMNLRRINAGGASSTNGYMTKSEAKRVFILVSDSATVTMDVGDDTVVEIDQHQDQAESTRVLEARASDAATVNIKGAATVVKCSGAATCNVDGTISNPENSQSTDASTLNSSASVTVNPSTTPSTTTGDLCINSATSGPPPPAVTVGTDEGGSESGSGGSADGLGTDDSGTTTARLLMFSSGLERIVAITSALSILVAWM